MFLGSSYHYCEVRHLLLQQDPERFDNSVVLEPGASLPLVVLSPLFKCIIGLVARGVNLGGTAGTRPPEFGVGDANV